MAGVGAADLEQVVVIAGDMVALLYFGEGRDTLEERPAVLRAPERDGDEGRQARADRLGIEERSIAADDPPLNDS